MRRIKTSAAGASTVADECTSHPHTRLIEQTSAPHFTHFWPLEASRTVELDRAAAFRDDPRAASRRSARYRHPNRQTEVWVDVLESKIVVVVVVIISSQQPRNLHGRRNVRPGSRTNLQLSEVEIYTIFRVIERYAPATLHGWLFTPSVQQVISPERVYR